MAELDFVINSCKEKMKWNYCLMRSVLQGSMWQVRGIHETRTFHRHSLKYFSISRCFCSLKFYQPKLLINMTLWIQVWNRSNVVNYMCVDEPYFSKFSLSKTHENFEEVFTDPVSTSARSETKETGSVAFFVVWTYDGKETVFFLLPVMRRSNSANLFMSTVIRTVSEKILAEKLLSEREGTDMVHFFSNHKKVFLYPEFCVWNRNLNYTQNKWSPELKFTFIISQLKGKTDMKCKTCKTEIKSINYR